MPLIANNQYFSTVAEFTQLLLLLTSRIHKILTFHLQTPCKQFITMHISYFTITKKSNNHTKPTE